MIEKKKKIIIGASIAVILLLLVIIIIAISNNNKETENAETLQTIELSEVINIEDIEKLYKNLNNGKIVAIGEIGLDYYWVKDNKEEQKKLFISQIDLANKLKLPIVVHSRDASLDTYLTLKEHPAKYGTLLHCFSPTEDLVRIVV